MELAELRKELLSQHAELRTLAEKIVAVAARVKDDPGALASLRSLLLDLVVGLCTHNAYEERELHAILPTVDAWGAARDALVQERHTSEHAAILGALGAATADPSAGAADATLLVLRDLFAHMEREEREFLGADVLRDDLVTSGVGG